MHCRMMMCILALALVLVLVLTVFNACNCIVCTCTSALARIPGWYCTIIAHYNCIIHVIYTPRSIFAVYENDATYNLRQRMPITVVEHTDQHCCIRCVKGRAWHACHARVLHTSRSKLPTDLKQTNKQTNKRWFGYNISVFETYLPFQVAPL